MVVFLPDTEAGPLHWFQKLYSEHSHALSSLITGVSYPGPALATRPSHLRSNACTPEEHHLL